MTSLISMLHEIDAMLPAQERLCPSGSAHKKHYPRLHALMQNNPPRLQSVATLAVSSPYNLSRSHNTFASQSAPRSSQLESGTLVGTSKSQEMKVLRSADATASPFFSGNDDLVLSPSTDTDASLTTGRSSISTQTPNTIALGNSTPQADADESDIALLSSEDELDDDHVDEDDLTSPLQIQPGRSAPSTTTSLTPGVVHPASVPVGYSPAMLNLQTVLPSLASEPSPKKTKAKPRRIPRSHSMSSIDSAESDASIRSLANHPLEVQKNRSQDRRKSAPFIFRQASGFFTKASSASVVSSQKSGRPKSFTLTGLFASAWAGVQGKLPNDDNDEDDNVPYEQDPHYGADEGYEDSEYSDHGLADAFAMPPPPTTRRKSTSSARLSLQRLMTLDSSNPTMK